MNLLLLGSKGQLGQELSRTLLPLGHLTCIDRLALDLTDLDAIRFKLESIKPDIIINAAAYTAVDKAEEDIETVWLVNSKAVEIMADYAKKNNALLVHYSTDYVFNGQKNGAYSERDTPNPLSQYGASKLAGEQAIISSGCRHLIFRTSWVFSVQGHNFIKTILNLAKTKDVLTVIDDQRGAPTSAELIADVTALAIQANQNEILASDLYHLTSQGITTWYGLACYIIDKAHAFQSDLLKITNIQPIQSECYPQIALRPQNSVLNTQLLSKNLNIILPPWQIYVDRMIHQLNLIGFFA